MENDWADEIVEKCRWMQGSIGALEMARQLRAAELRGRVKGMFDAAQIARGSHTAVGYDIFAAIHTAATKLESPPTT